MMIFYLLGIKVYFLLMKFAALFNPKANLWIEGRKGLLKRIKNEIGINEKIAWFHCASLGEFEQGRPVIENFKEKHTDYKILLTFFSPSGYEIRKNYEHADYVYYLPLDTPNNAKRFVKFVNPSMVFFVKYEFWPFFIREIGKRNIPLYLISGIFRRDQRFFKWYGFQARKTLKNFKHFFVQNKKSKGLLESIKLYNTTISGDTRFDRVYSIAQNTKELPLIKKYINNKTTLIAGSTWKPDEEIIVSYFNDNPSKFKLIIAPHEIHNENINRIQNSFNSDVNVMLFSDATESNIDNADVLIINSIGLLSSLYKYANIAYIGGGFGKGIHNTLEAATFGLPIIFGPNYLKFQEAVDLIKQESSFSISSLNEFEIIINTLLRDNDLLKDKGNLSAQYVKQKCGASNSILNSVDIDFSSIKK
jgi:3-deoxy-D-manno-octulosonic-acid transferase